MGATAPAPPVEQPIPHDDVSHAHECPRIDYFIFVDPGSISRFPVRSTLPS